MTIMLPGVATGVRNAAADITLTAISSGLPETPNAAAADSAIGITTSAVAVLLINWPSTAVIRISPMSSGYGPASPTTSTSPSAINCAAPVDCSALDSGMMPPSSTTVVHEIARYAWLTLSTPSRMSALAASRPATAAGTRPVASSTTIPTSTAMARPAPRPIGTDWRRTISGESTTRTSASSSFAASASQVPWTSNVSPAARVVSSGPRSSPWRWIARITRSPLLATMPGNTACRWLPSVAGSSARPPRPRR